MRSPSPAPEQLTFVGPMLDERGILPKRELAVGRAESLSVMTEEYTFFTPAILYIHGCFWDGLLLDFIHQVRQEVDFFFRRFPQPIFGGLETEDGDADWNYALWAIRPEFWAPLAGFLCGVTLTQVSSSEVIRYGEQELDICDPLALERSGFYRPNLPRLRIGVLGINGSQFRAALTPAPNSVSLPHLDFHPPALEIVRFAAALKSGSNPYHTVHTVTGN